MEDKGTLQTSGAEMWEAPLSGLGAWLPVPRALDPGPRGNLERLLASELENCPETQDEMKSSLTLCVIQFASI